MDTYKPIRLENNKGELLCACPTCSIYGQLMVCTKTKEFKNGKSRIETKRIPKTRQATYIRNGWKIQPYLCEMCGGAGLYPVRKLGS